MIFIAPMLPSFPWKTGTLAVLAIAPAMLLLDGSWNAGGIFMTPIAGLLINLSMICSLLVLIAGSPMAWTLLWCEKLLHDLLRQSASSNLVFGWTGYLIALGFVLTLFFALIYAKRNPMKQETYELELSLRFTQRDYNPLGEEGLAMSRKFGQNFLISNSSRTRIVDLLDVQAGKNVWEVGPGRSDYRHPS